MINHIENIAIKEHIMNKLSFTILLLLVLLFIAVYAYTHSGGLDEDGGHTDQATGEYHFHGKPNAVTPTETAVPPIPYVQEDFTGDTTYKVIRIVDGDTVIISYEGTNTTIRLIGVDTPETKHPDKGEEEYGAEASEFTQNLLQGESVYLRFDDQNTTDRYGRTLAYLYRVPDGLFVNLEIVRQGYGTAYTAFPFGFIDLFRHYNERARITKKGLWSDQNNNHPADINGDGTVNILDLVTVANAIGNN